MKLKIYKMLIIIPTLGREGKQITINQIPLKWRSRTFLVCPKGEKHPWTNRLDLEPPGSYGKTMQWILENAPDRYIGVMDDDLQFYKRDADNKTRKTLCTSEEMSEFLDTFESWLTSGDVYGSCSNSFMMHTNDDEYFYGKPSACHFFDREYLLKHDIRFDRMSEFSDFDVPLSVIESGKRLHHTGKFISKEKKANAPGGCSLSRTAETARNSMLKLRELHPKYVTLKEEPGATNQTLKVDLKMTIQFKKAYDECVPKGDSTLGAFL